MAERLSCDSPECHFTDANPDFPNMIVSRLGFLSAELAGYGRFSSPSELDKTELVFDYGRQSFPDSEANYRKFHWSRNGLLLTAFLPYEQ